MPLVKSTHQDAGLNSLKSAITHCYLCPSDPANYAAALASALVVLPVTNTDLTLAAGDVNGRKLHWTGGNAAATANGNVTRAVFVNANSGTEDIHFINNITQTAVTTAGNVTINAFDLWEINNPI